MRAFMLVALFGITAVGCVQPNDDEELSPDEVASVEQAAVAGCSITVSAPFIGKCKSSDSFNSIVGRASVSCTTLQSSITVFSTLQKITADETKVLATVNTSFPCNNVLRCFSTACMPVASGTYKTFGSSTHTDGVIASGKSVF